MGSSIDGYKILWYFLHIVCSVYDVVINSYEILRKRIRRFTVSQRSEVDYIADHVKRLTKLPHHLTVLLGQEELSYPDLAKFVTWSVTAGIKYISFYDVTGVIRSNLEELQSCVDELRHARNPQQHVIWHVNGKESYTNGVLGAKIHAKALCAADGRQSIARVTRQLAEDFATSPEDITIEMVDDQLRRAYEFPDPDLAMYCTPVFTIAGYPPWQIRLTEFVRFGDHRNACVDDFVTCLARYAKCEQRKGK